MSERERPDLHGLVGGYVVDALDDLERRQFERHLDSCSVCRADVVELREGLAELSHLTAQAPPPQLRDRVLGEAARVRPLPPVSPVPQVSRRGLPWGRLLVAAAAAAALAVGGWSFTEQRTLQRQSADLRAEDQRQGELMTAPDAAVRPLVLADGSRVAVLSSQARGEALVVTGSATAPPPGKVYQLWLMRDGTPVPDATFTPDAGRVDHQSPA